MCYTKTNDVDQIKIVCGPDQNMKSDQNRDSSLIGPNKLKSTNQKRWSDLDQSVKLKQP